MFEFDGASGFYAYPNFYIVGYELTRSNYKSGIASYSYGCRKGGDAIPYAAMIMMDNWEIKDDYPW